MEITIKGEPKEIAALLFAATERQEDLKSRKVFIEGIAQSLTKIFDNTENKKTLLQFINSSTVA